MSERTARNALAGLVDRGHVISKRRGMKKTNLYFAAIKDDGDRQKVADHERHETPGQKGVTGTSTSSDRQNYVRLTGRNLPTTPLNELLKEPNGDIDSHPRDFVDEDFGRHSRSLSSDLDGSFEIWWAVYPLKKANAAARSAYGTAVTKKLATPEQLLAGAERYAAERSGQDPKYTKHPATWLRGGCWADEPTNPIGRGYDHIKISADMAR